MEVEQLTKAYDFAGKTVVVSGATGVLGGEIARALAGCGAQLAILHRNPDRGRALLQRLGSHASPAALFRADVLNAKQLAGAARDVSKRFGCIHGLVNAAGGNLPDATTRPDARFFDLPAEALRRVLDLNLVGTILCCQSFGRAMAESGGGAILNISSMAAFRPLTGIPAYSAAKAGVSNFTQWLAVHLAQEYSPGIRVNAIAPGFFLTGQNRFLLRHRKTGRWTARGRAILAHTPLKRMGVPEDLVGAALWLLSPAAAFVTGVVLPIDGGFSAYSGV